MQCCQDYVGELWREIKYASLADKHLPQAGGLLDQSAWFLELWVALQNEQTRIEKERQDKWLAKM